MLKGLYTAAAGMMTQQRRHDTVSSNIANLQTPGYKQQTTTIRSFPELLMQLQEGGEPAKQIGTLTTGVFAEENLFQFLQGDVRETSRPGDFALISDIQLPNIQFDSSGKAIIDGEVTFQPQAFFTLQGMDGQERYTRNGQFQLDENGRLMNQDGLSVLGRDGQPIIIADIPFDQVSVSGNGMLVNRANGLPMVNDNMEILQLRISRVDNPYDLIREGNGNFYLSADAVPAVIVDDADAVEVKQGFIEGSNVDPAQSMVDLMTALRMYEANQKVIQYYDKSLEKAVNEIGRI